MRLDQALAELVEIVQRVQISALMDDKTPLKNGMGLVQKLEGLVEIPEEHIVIFGDLNGFKLVNDSFGHAAGDAAIERTGKLLKVMLEPFDAEAFRQSGDEFVIVCKKEQLPLVSEALANTFKSTIWYHSQNKIELKMSFGWTVAQRESPRHWLHRAEEACRVAKQQGPGIFLEWLPEHNCAPDEVRSRCSECGASFRFVPSPSRSLDKSHLWCPQCGHQA